MSNVPFSAEQARAATDGQIDAETVDGQDASDLGNHIEAKQATDKSGGSSVSWTTAFGTVPIVVANLYANTSSSISDSDTTGVVSKSTTGCETYSTSDSPDQIIAMEET